MITPLTDKVQPLLDADAKAYSEKNAPGRSAPKSATSSRKPPHHLLPASRSKAGVVARIIRDPQPTGHQMSDPATPATANRPKGLFSR